MEFRILVYWVKFETTQQNNCLDLIFTPERSIFVLSSFHGQNIFNKLDVHIQTLPFCLSYVILIYCKWALTFRLWVPTIWTIVIQSSWDVILCWVHSMEVIFWFVSFLFHIDEFFSFLWTVHPKYTSFEYWLIDRFPTIYLVL